MRLDSCFPSYFRRTKKAAAPAAPPPWGRPRAIPEHQASRERDRLREEANMVRASTLSLIDQAHRLASEVDQLVALEIDQGYPLAPSCELQQSLLRLLPPIVASQGPQAPHQAPLAATPQAVAAAMVHEPDFADAYAWAFLEHVRVTFVPAPAPNLKIRLTFAHTPPPMDLRDHVHHAALALRRVLPASHCVALDTLTMHFDHEVLSVVYRNKHTMVLNEPISSVPRASFLATADGYAWDMEELVQAIAANGGVFKNPLTHLWFSESDIRAILAHPLGAELRRAQAAQESLRDGVRRDTAVALHKVGAALMNDRANDGNGAVASAWALAEFRAFVLTLPESEQRDIAALRTTGIDRHTRTVYSASTVQSVLDDTGTCFHKRGDLLEQTAAALLQRLDRR